MTNHFASNWKIPFVLFLAFLLKATSLYGQIEVEPAITAPFSPESLIKNVFLGDFIFCIMFFQKHQEKIQKHQEKNEKRQYEIGKTPSENGKT